MVASGRRHVEAAYFWLQALRSKCLLNSMLPTMKYMISGNLTTPYLFKGAWGFLVMTAVVGCLAPPVTMMEVIMQLRLPPRPPR